MFYNSYIHGTDGGDVITPSHLELELPKLMCYVFILQGWQSFSERDQIVNILGFERHI